MKTDFIGDDSVALILGDNIYCGASLSQLVRASTKKRPSLVTALTILSTSGSAISVIRISDRQFSQPGLCHSTMLLKGTTIPPWYSNIEGPSH